MRPTNGGCVLLSGPRELRFFGRAIDISTAPVVATHHGLRAVNNIPRNMPDELIRKLAAKGGVIGFQLGSEFHSRKAFEWRSSAEFCYASFGITAQSR